MSAIKKFFKEKALDVKFKKLGTGKRLTDSKNVPQASSSKNKSSSNEKKVKNVMTDEKRMAAQAALARLELKKENENKGYTKGTMTMKAELLAEQKEAEALAQKYAIKKPLDFDTSKVVSGVYFTCPSLGITTPMLKDHLHLAIEDYLLSQLVDEPELTSILMIQMLNMNKSEVKTCLEMLEKYLNNIISKPADMTFRKIKCSNKVLNEKVLNCKGANEFLQAIGFESRVLEGTDGNEEEFLVLDCSQENAEDLADRLRGLLEVMKASEPPALELDPDLKVFKVTDTSSCERRMEVPDEFYNILPEELKREQKLREEAVKEMGMLITKEMRERERLKALRRYKFAVIRVRFPDGYLVQGTFKTTDKLSDVRMFLSELLDNGAIEFKLVSGLGAAIENEDNTLAELNLVPASLLTLSVDNPSKDGRFLKQNYRELAEKF